jgi:DNA-binding transcriptional ArsR family regulator
MSDVFKALADPTRRRILELLRNGPMTAGTLAGHFAVSKPTMSGHFAVLKDADLIQADKAGTSITYRINTSVLEGALLTMLQTFGFSARLGERHEHSQVREDRADAGRSNGRARRSGVVRSP